MNSPLPSAEAVEAATREFHGAMPNVPAWDDLHEVTRRNMRQAMLRLLTAAYPQIVDDVLNHYADQLDMADLTGDVDMYVTWLIQQASQVRP